MMIKYLRGIVGVAVLGACVLGISCGSGSQAAQTSLPVQDGGSGTLATGSHVFGDAGAKVTMVEFCDFQCPYCKGFYTDTEAQIVETYVNTGKVKMAFRQFPLSSIHQNASVAAQASECAAKVGSNDGFWKFHDALFTYGQSNGAGLDSASLKQYAADLHLDTAGFDSCLDNRETAASVGKDVAEGQAAGVGGTPTFFINGKKFAGAQTFDGLKAAIEAEL